MHYLLNMYIYLKMYVYNLMKFAIAYLSLQLPEEVRLPEKAHLSSRGYRRERGGVMTLLKSTK